jgi:hypothetical protein
MAENSVLPVFATALAGCRDAFRAVGRMPTTFLIGGVAIVVAQIVLGIVIAAAIGVKPWRDSTLNFNAFALAARENFSGLWFLLFFAGAIENLALALLVTPLAISVHRFVLLGETTNRYEFAPRSLRFRQFFGFAAILTLIPTALSLAQFALNGFYAQSPASFILFAVLFAANLVMIVVLVRTVIVFPAIASDASGPNWRGALADTSGHFWKIVLIFLVAFLLLYLPLIVAWMFFGAILFAVGNLLLTGIFLAVFEALVEVAYVAVAAAIASRLYRAYARSLPLPSNLIPTAALTF